MRRLATEDDLKMGRADPQLWRFYGDRICEHRDLGHAVRDAFDRLEVYQ